MGHNWIIDVLTDLKSFAQQNDLPLLAAQLDEVTSVASAEIVGRTPNLPVFVQGEQTGTRQFLAKAGASRRAG